MPSVSKAQQAIMGQAWALRQNELKASDIDPKYRKEIKNIAFGYKDKDGKFIAPMTDKELKKFAKTKSKDLPENVKDGKPVNEDEGAIKGEIAVNTGVVDSKGLPSISPKMSFGGDIKPIIPYLNPDSKKSKAGKRNLENLKDYRDWIKQSKKK
jgi:hypothetical protein